MFCASTSLGIREASGIWRMYPEMTEIRRKHTQKNMLFTHCIPIYFSHYPEPINKRISTSWVRELRGRRGKLSEHQVIKTSWSTLTVRSLRLCDLVINLSAFVTPRRVKHSELRIHCFGFRMGVRSRLGICKHRLFIRWMRQRRLIWTTAWRSFCISYSV